MKAGIAASTGRLRPDLDGGRLRRAAGRRPDGRARARRRRRRLGVALHAGGHQVGGPPLKRLMSRTAGLTLHWFAGVADPRPDQQLQALLAPLPRRDHHREHGRLRAGPRADGQGDPRPPPRRRGPDDVARPDGRPEQLQAPQVAAALPALVLGRHAGPVRASEATLKVGNLPSCGRDQPSVGSALRSSRREGRVVFRSTARPRVRGILAVMIAVACLMGASIPGTALAAGGNHTQTKVIVTFRHGQATDAKTAVRAFSGRVGRRFHLIDGFAASLPVAAINALRRNKSVASVERDGHLELLDTPTGDLEYDNAWGVPHIGVEARPRGRDPRPGVKVAVIDTGIDYIHDQPAIPSHRSSTPSSSATTRAATTSSTTTPTRWTTTATARTSPASSRPSSNGYLVVGVAPGVDLYALKILGASGSGRRPRPDPRPRSGRSTTTSTSST